MTRKLLEIAAEIVQAQASVGHMSPDDLELALAKSFITLQRMQKAEEDGVMMDLVRSADDASQAGKAQEKMEAKDSIMEDKIICLECGAEMRQLTAKHLGSHGLSPRDYKRKYDFPLKQSLSAKSLSKARSKAAKKRGLPENLLKFQEERKLRRTEEMGSEQAPESGGVVEERGRGKAPSKSSGKKRA